LIANRISVGLTPAAWRTNYWDGKVEQERNYFWYRRTFRAPAQRAAAAWVQVNKAQFGMAVWLNGEKLGTEAACFSAGRFPAAHALRWGAENTLLIRIGAHPLVLPSDFPVGSDFEKKTWTPGIYDRVALVTCDNPVIETIQVAPRLATGEILVQTTVKNHSATPVHTALTHAVKPWKSGRIVSVGQPEPLTLQPGEEKISTQTLAIPDARWWSPEDPFLYVVESRTGGDTVTTRFGMREFRFDAATKRAWLNGKVYYLRGSNITLHRFFEDPECGDRPWDERWVRRLLGERPRQMHWNYFRFCIGPVPQQWFDICDEEGLLVQNEFPVWTGKPTWYPGYERHYDNAEMIRQYAAWMRDHWNHPSVAVWDANNETLNPEFGATIIPALRGLDLSGRSWENSYNAPAGPDDMVEYHPYLMGGGYKGRLTFRMTDLEKMDGTPKPGELPSTNHPPVINEYGWLWLNRDGSPTLLTENVYAQLMGTNVTARERLDLYAYLLAAKTEFWRAHRQFAGIIHFVYLTCSYPGVYTADHFADVGRLKLDPAFADYVGEAFKPLGVYVNFFQPTLPAGTNRAFTILLINDHDQPRPGELTLTLETAGGRVLARSATRFHLDPLGSARSELTLTIPAAPGRCILKATARADGDPAKAATRSRRWITVTP
jgi:beta-galactosidase